MIGLFNSTYMNVNLAITMTCMVNSTAIAIAEEAAGPGDMTDNITLPQPFDYDLDLQGMYVQSCSTHTSKR
ncbi:hypothetical protein ANCDUO_27435 [Ancylostoma duodenale]|uniref:Uncharacterized protein n=1 Tax=Ancylostoma duodenale TaxID=51022 RepID=A0A0C2F213_9BILA|nr:hypothetical protein ANCDUO_27435 [Ancylostoma duodenale]